jgi:hypothetical protein
VKRYEKYGRNTSWIVIRKKIVIWYEKYGRNPSWIVKRFAFHFSTYFSPIFPYHFIHIFHIISQFSSVFSKSFHSPTYLSFIISISFHISNEWNDREIWEKSKLKSEKILNIWKKGKFNSEMIWKIWKISALVIITPKDFSYAFSIFFHYSACLFPILSISYHYSTCFSSIYYPYHFTIQTTFLPYFPKDLENTEENCEMIWKIWMKW